MPDRERRVPDQLVRVSEAEIDIDSIAAGGDGVGRMDGLVAFVPRTAPGDRARIRYASGRRFARGEVLRLLRESPTRTAPSCPHYLVDRCGGCQIQHLSYASQLGAKSHIIRDAFARIGHRDIALPEVVPSPAEWRYRSKLTLAMRRRDGSWIAGLHPYDDPSVVFPLTDCPITAESVLAMWRRILAFSSLLPRADELRGSVRDDAFTLEGGSKWDHAAEFFASLPELSELWWAPDDAPLRLLHTRTSDALGPSFAQVNAGLASTLHAYVVDRAWVYEPSRVIDAYSGRGATALALAERGAHVTAIESDRAAESWVAERLPTGSRSIAGRVEDALSDALPADVAILNPPRAGVDATVTEILAGPEGPRAIVYVSCDPATLARDVARLAPYSIASVRAFDMFPQTAHVETVCELTR
ncbi:MAG TPA: TRAM domain-containing protein [Gemmatimonadaceae bacterium]|nr:TRAM domain-containing protein [Gemmatimonadaceae bacterium]